MSRPDTKAIIAKARAIVKQPPPHFGYSDVGDVLVRYLRTEINPAQALELLAALAVDYDNARTREP